MVEYTALQLTERWEAFNEIGNIMGRITNYVLIRKFDHILENFWCKEAPEPSLGIGDGFYKGYDAVSGYFKALTKLDIERAAAVQAKYPDELGALKTEEAVGAGAIAVLNFTTPVIEIAEDFKTAKGIWYLMGGTADFHTDKAMNKWGRVAADFVNEGGAWKIWHMLTVLDIDTGMGKSWAEPEESDAHPGLPAPNVPVKVYEPYHRGRALARFPRVPERYETFAETFSYGCGEVTV